jgi:hypothetical protein
MREIDYTDPNGTEVDLITFQQNMFEILADSGESEYFDPINSPSYQHWYPSFAGTAVSAFQKSRFHHHDLVHLMLIIACSP